MPDKPSVLLEGWQLLTLHGRPYQLVGFASDHPFLPGHRRLIRTSRVLLISADETEAETVNTHYRLRRPITDMRLDLALPIFIALADLVAERGMTEEWCIRRDGHVLADGIPGYQIAILCMLDLLDRRGH